MRRRDFGGPDDLIRMQRAVQRGWAPGAQWHIGDLAWQWNSGLNSWRVALWEDGDGEVRAWGRVDGDGHLDFHAEDGLADEVLAWADPLTVTVRDDGPAPLFRHCVRELDDLETPKLPSGYSVRTVRGEEEAGARAAVHRAAWQPARIGELLVPAVALSGESRVTTERYRDVMGSWPYRTELDLVVEGPGGDLVAFALGWLDEVNRVGELEPVGTHPDHARRGLGAAVSLACLHAMREAGATRAVVHPRGDDAYPVPGRLYRGLGFRPVAGYSTAAASRIKAA
ncbi:GNAT family N-acetyltransferase [Actinoplanes sp. NPDC048796]|uniref:GNAT family N-acetyltransferase n=1 Tax=unclassified Actinoplanes TaxID=2626549 RepID=UPI003406FA69